MSFPQAAISDLCDKIVVGHVGPSSGHRQEGGIPFLMGKNVGAGFLKLDALERVTPEFHEAQKKSQLSPGDVVVVRIGKSGQAAKVPGELGEANCSGLVVVKGPREVTADYLVHYLNSPAGRRQSLKQAKGSTRQTLNTKSIAATRIPFPPLAEQKRIAVILDAADALRANRRESLAQLDTLLQSTFLDMFGDCDRPPISIGNPTFGEDSRFVLLSSVARLATGHTPDRKIPEYWNGEIPWISLTDIRQLDGAVATQTLQNVTEAGIANSSSVKLPPGTVCFSRTASVGFVLVMGREMATSQDFVNWVCGEQLNPIYLMWSLRQSRPYLLSKSSGSTHKTIYYRHAEQFQIYLPPFGLQHRFAAIVESVEQQKASHRAHLDELDTLFASLQSRAFQGDL